MQPDDRRNLPATGAKLKVREIREADLGNVAKLLNQGFSFRSIDYWLTTEYPSRRSKQVPGSYC